MTDPTVPSAPEVKSCCAALYGSDVARFLLGESFHPGGVGLTLELTGSLRLNSASTVLDVAAGKGTSAFEIAEQFGCAVVGVDLSATNVADANAAAGSRGLADRVRFEVGDAESLRFPSAAFDAVLCECAFCTFPNKRAAAAEFARVLRPGGSVALSDVTRIAHPLPELEGLLAWIACIADAQPLEGYARWLAEAGFNVTASIQRDDALEAMVEQVQGRILFAEVMTGLQKFDIPQFDIAQAKSFLAAAQHAVKRKELGYGLLLAELPGA